MYEIISVNSLIINNNSMQDITKIFGQILSNITYQFECTASVPSGTNFILYTNNTYWLRPEKWLVIGGKNYKIIALTINESITVQPIGHNTAPSIGVLFTIPPPVYKHGTARAINSELTTIEQIDKTPFVWLFELLREKVIVDSESTIDLEAEIRLFIFDEANPSDMLTEDHYADVIRPLKQLAETIVAYINAESGLYSEVLEYEIMGLPDWGEFNEMKGNESRIFDELWSGLEMRFTLQILKQQKC